MGQGAADAPVPTLTLRADAPDHFRLLVAASQRLQQEFGASHPLTKLASTYVREFEVWQESKRVPPKAAPSTQGRGDPGIFPDFPRF